jgi:hypothetical protein
MRVALKADQTHTPLNATKDKNLNRRIVWHIQGLGRTLTEKEFKKFYKLI